MIDSIKRITLDLHDLSSRETVEVKRSDNGRKICISLIDGGMPYHIAEGCYAVFTGRKPDNKVVYNDCTIEGNVIIYELTEQTSLIPGLVKCEIKLYGADNKLITSPRFSIMVDDTVYDEGDEIESTDEFNALTKLISDVLSLTGGGGMSTTVATLLVTILRNAVYGTDQSANIDALKTALESSTSGGEVPDIPDEPIEPDIPEKTLTSISAVYSGGSVTAGTAVNALTGIVVTAHYSDGTSESVTGYTLSGTIAEGSNTITVSYGGKTTTFTVVGVAESGGDSADIHDGYISDGLEFRLDAIRNTESGHDSALNVMMDVSGNGYAIENYQTNAIVYDTYIGPNGQNQRSSHRIIEYATILAKMATFTVEVVSQPIGTPGDNTILFSVGNGNQKTLLAANGRMRLNDNTNTAYGTADTDVSTIKHYTITYDGSNMNLYHEGVLDASQPATTGITTSEDCEFFSNKDWANHTMGYFNAARIYTRALTAAEVKANYDNDIARFGTVNVEVA